MKSSTRVVGNLDCDYLSRKEWTNFKRIRTEQDQHVNIIISENGGIL